MKVTITIEDEELKGMKNDTVRAMARLLTGKDFDLSASTGEPGKAPAVQADAKEASSPEKASKPAPAKEKPAKKAEPAKESVPEPAPDAAQEDKTEKPERTADELKKALKEFCTSHDGGAAKIQAKFKELGITKASEATREQLERVLKEVNE